ncbi:MAG: tyrosine-protein kinase family protein [Candidatus Dadabacteria bacterium]|nr:MAG: tyrosine-protein kinase family protein [Candidatus Dadabacteria bacterium]
MSKTYEALKRAEELRARQRSANEAHGPLELPVSTADEYYELRRQLTTLSVGEAIRTVLVVSALHGEGVSSVACLLGRAMAGRKGGDVLLVDLNLRTPSLWRLLGAQSRLGVATAVAEGRPVEEFVQDTGTPGLKLLTAGNGFVDAIEVIDNPETAKLLTSLRQREGVTIIDCAPVTLYPDARALAAIVDGVILVIEADVTPVSVAARAVDILREAGGNLLGVVLNKRRDYIPARVLQLIG